MENKDKKKGSSKIKVIIIGILILAVVGVGAYFGYNKFLKKDTKTNTAQNGTVQQTNTQQVQNNGQNSSTIVNSNLDQIVSSQTFELDEVTINLADEGGSRYAKVKAFLGFNDKSLTAELTTKKPIVTDAVIGILRTKKAADIVPKNMNSIKLEIIQKINPMLQKGQLNNVYFTDIVIQ